MRHRAATLFAGLTLLFLGALLLPGCKRAEADPEGPPVLSGDGRRGRECTDDELRGQSLSSRGDWGTIKGRVVFGGNKFPDRAALDVNKDQADCMPGGKKLYSEDWVIDPKTKGCKWCFVYLVPADARTNDDLNKPLPIRPDPNKEKAPDPVVDQPCCMFEPYCLGVREGQSLVMKNSSKIAHNARFSGDTSADNPDENPFIQPGGQHVFGPLHAQWSEIPIGCNIHGWMGCHVRVFSHPYFVVTGDDGTFEIKDGPAGKVRLVIWHPGAFFLLGDKSPDKFGKQIEIKANETTDLGEFKVPPPGETK
jgi:hypothetical protein